MSVNLNLNNKLVELPAAARKKLLALTGAMDDAAELGTSCQRRINQDHTADPAIVEQLTEKRDRNNARFAALKKLTDRIKQWHRSLPPGTMLEAAPPVIVKVQEGLTLIEQLTQTQDAGRAARQHLELVARAPLPTADAQALAASLVAHHARRGAPHHFAETSGRLSLTFQNPQGDSWTNLNSVWEMFCWIAPELATAALRREIASSWDEPENPLTIKERSERTAELEARIDLLDRQEESLIEAAAQQGIDVTRRPDASPQAVLGVRVIAPKAKAQARAA